MAQLLIHLPDNLANRFRALVPPKQRSKYIESLLNEALAKKNDELSASAIAIEKDANINSLIRDFEIVSGDGIDEQK